MENQDKKINLLLEDLSSLEDYVHDLFTFSPLPICFVSPLGVILEANPAFLKVSNYGFGEIVGEAIENLFEKQAIRKLSRETLKKGFIEGEEMKFFRKDKESMICQVFTKTRKDEQGRPVGYFLGLFDLAGVKKSEEELKAAQSALLNILDDTEEARRKAEEEKNKTQAIITGFVDGLLVFDKENRLVLANPQAENFLKVKSQNIIGKSTSELSGAKNLEGLISILMEKPSLASASAKATADKKSVEDGELKGIFRKEWDAGENLVLEVSTIPLMAGEQKTGTLVVLHDISREKIVERLKTEFVSISAHQLRTPLSAIKWTLRMLLDGDLGEITKEQREFLEKTYRSNERMIILINSLLNVTRIEEGRFLYRPTLAEIDKLVESVVEMLKEEAERKRVKLGLERDKKLPKVHIDIEKIKLAVQNLVDNALKYTLPGGEVKVALKYIDGEIRFSVKDTGVGIRKDQQERVFSKFFRGANVMRLETEGSGLGLFITKNIIEAHGGKIWFESEENKGTTFYFTLPIKKEFEEFLEKF